MIGFKVLKENYLNAGGRILIMDYEQEAMKQIFHPIHLIRGEHYEQWWICWENHTRLVQKRQFDVDGRLEEKMGFGNTGNYKSSFSCSSWSWMEGTDSETKRGSVQYVHDYLLPKKLND